MTWCASVPESKLQSDMMPLARKGISQVQPLQLLIKTWASIALLLEKPQQLPGDMRSMKIALLAAIVTNILATLVLVESRFLLAEALLDIVLAGTCLYASLTICGKPERFIQSFSAYCGVGVILNLVSLVLLGPTHIGQSASAQGTIGLFLEVLMLVWGIAAIAHIVRYSFEISLPFGVVVAVLYVQVYIMFASVFLSI